MKYEINFLPARYGDSIWIEYGDGAKTNRILIDGGTQGTRHNIMEMISRLPEEDRHFELIVVTHIDRDHIEGVLSLLEDDALAFSVGDFWFNGWKHLPEDNEEFGAVQGERLTAAIIKHGLNWNGSFGGDAIVVFDDGGLPEVRLPGGMVLTLLSPERENLVRLKSKWESELIKNGLVPGFGAETEDMDNDGEEAFGALPDIEALNQASFKEDDAPANGSSIAFIASFGGHDVLFAGDAFPGVVLKSLNSIYDDKAPMSLVKLSHHGSKGNTSPQLIEKLDSGKYVISTNGSNFSHPDRETIARVIKRGGNNVELYFNYLSEDNRVWNSPTLQSRHGYQARYPENGSEGIRIVLR